jgi:hypothetical protein
VVATTFLATAWLMWRWERASSRCSTAARPARARRIDLRRQVAVSESAGFGDLGSRQSVALTGFRPARSASGVPEFSGITARWTAAGALAAAVGEGRGGTSGCEPFIGIASEAEEAADVGNTTSKRE